MTAPKAGTYVLVANAFYRVEGEGDEATRRRYKRGDRVVLTKAEAARLAVPSRLAPAAFVKADDAPEGLVPGDTLVTAPPVVVNRESQANQLIAEANTGLTTPSPDAGTLTTEQVETAVDAPLVTGAGAGDTVPTPIGDVATPVAAPATADGTPPRSATLDVWRAYAVKVGAVTEAEAGDLTKAQLQGKVSDHTAAQQ